ncbi:MAG: MerR family transcriptional regulator [Chloroflexota bacterium]
MKAEAMCKSSTGCAAGDMAQPDLPGDAQAARDEPRYMQIGEVAERTGLTQRTLRYYEEIGLLPPAARMEGGFRLYTEADLRRLETIVQLKRLLGISLAEIKRIVEADELLHQLRQERKRASEPAEKRAVILQALTVLQEQIATIDGRIAQMQALRERYAHRLARLQERLAQLEEERGS